MKLNYKIEIKGILKVETGLHIGGSEVELEIGGLDNAVVKDTRTGKPYIPGSSLKGKLRDLIARKMGYENLKDDRDATFILFGEGANDKYRNTGHLIVRDAFFRGNNFDPDKDLEEKSENTIKRSTGKATPRIMERVVNGAEFDLEMIVDIYNTYNYRSRVKKPDENIDEIKMVINRSFGEKDLLDTLKLGFQLLEYDYLGGSGTRGYGKVSIHFKQLHQIEFVNGEIKRTPMNYNLNS